LKSSRKVHGEELDALAGGILRFGIATRAARIIKRIGRSFRLKILTPPRADWKELFGFP